MARLLCMQRPASSHTETPHHARSASQCPPISLRWPCSAAGSYASGSGWSACLPCEPTTYAPGRGAAQCAPCPGGTFAHLPGAQTCVACFFGIPMALANDDAATLNSLPAELPSPGERIGRVRQ